ncbi:MAG: ribonucleotide reductase N-terminal alpha domain-containing protein, partial [Bacteroidales bacterium]|nr:ribonucleotide reductase N-terminal alpha domain-containing protein [Bacteroidales bacterium]
MELDLFSSSSSNEVSVSTNNETEQKVVAQKQKSKTEKNKNKEMELKELNKEEIQQSCERYFKGDTLAADVWVNKYALRDGDKVYELNPDQMHRRLAREFARIENKYSNPMSEDEIYELLRDFKYIIPQGSP